MRHCYLAQRASMDKITELADTATDGMVYHEIFLRPCSRRFYYLKFKLLELLVGAHTAIHVIFRALPSDMAISWHVCVRS